MVKMMMTKLVRYSLLSFYLSIYQSILLFEAYPPFGNSVEDTIFHLYLYRNVVSMWDTSES